MRSKRIEKNTEVNFTEGPILAPLIRYSLPIMAGNILQLLFNAADIIVVGQFVGNEAVAAVGGSTGVIVTLIVSLFTGLSIGATALLSMRVGEKSPEISDIVHTTFTLGAGIGILVAFVGFVISTPFLRLLSTPDGVLELASLYLRIYFLGSPGFMIYTFSRSILISQGDTRSPVLYLTVSGIINILLNVFLVVVIHLDVAGVAIATITSQYISAILITKKLRSLQGAFHLSFLRLRIDWRITKQISALGIPSGLQVTMLAVAGILLQSSVNRLGTDIIAGQSAANSLMSMAAQGMNAFSQGALTITAQNFGAGKFNRIRITFRDVLLTDAIAAFLLGTILITGSRFFIGIYLGNNVASIEAGTIGLRFNMSFAILLAYQDASAFVLRGMNHSVSPMVTSIVGNCVFRIFWVLFVFNRYAGDLSPLEGYRLIICTYPIGWAIIFLANILLYRIAIRKYPVNPAG